MSWTKEVTISVKLSVKDMYYFMLRHTYTAVSGWFGIIISIAAFIMFIMGAGKEDQVMSLLLIFMSLLFTVINPVILFTKSWKQVKLNPMFQKPILYGFGKEGIEVAQDEERAEIFWKDVMKAICRKSYIIIYMSRVRAFILPVKQFEEEYPEILGMIKENVSSDKIKLKA